MSAILKLIIAGTAAALVSASAGMAAERLADTSTASVTAQQDCRGWGVRCEPDVMPEFCIADGKCATALPATALVRYDARMDAVAGH